MKKVLVIWIDGLEVSHFTVHIPEGDILKLRKFNNRLIHAASDKTMKDYFYDDNGKLKFVKENKVIESQWFDLIITAGIIE